MLKKLATAALVLSLAVPAFAATPAVDNAAAPANMEVKADAKAEKKAVKADKKADKKAAKATKAAKAEKKAAKAETKAVE